MYNINLVAGEAPRQLSGLPDPDRVFIGGSGGRLAELVDHAADRLLVGGLMVASAVLEKTAEQAPELMAKKGLEVAVRTVSITRNPGAGLAEKKLNPITIITGKK